MFFYKNFQLFYFVKKYIIFKSNYLFFLLFAIPTVVFLSAQVINSNSQEDIEEDVVTTYEENDEVHGWEQSDALDTAESLDTIVHYDVPILTG